MKIRHPLCLLICTCCLPVLLFSQEIYSFQKDDSILKKKYFDQSMRGKTALIGSHKEKYAKDYKEVFDRQFNEIGNLLTSSRSVTSPEAHEYLQALVKEIIDVNPELRTLDPRVVFSRDWWPNAYSLGDGTISINAGLVIFLDNEAQLVFAICHELSHYYLRHTQASIEKYVQTVNSDSFQQKLRRISKQQFGAGKELDQLEKSLMFDSRLHSRSNEAEADLQAFRFMRRTGYDCNAITSCLQLMDKIDDSSLYKPLELEQVFNFKDYPFRNRWIQKESAIFSQLDENASSLSPGERDSLKTHPNCSKRILLLSDSIRTVTPGSKFLVNEALFNKLKKEFGVELSEQCYRAGNLSRNLYYSLQMLQANENTTVAVYSIARDLNQVYEKQRDHKLGLSIEAEDRKYATDYNLLLRMLDRLKLDEIGELNFQFCKQYYEQMKGFPAFKEEVKKLPKVKINSQ